MVRCASAIRWGGFKEYIFGTTIEYLIERGEFPLIHTRARVQVLKKVAGWGQIRISSYDVFEKSFELSPATRMLGEVLTNATDPLFSWQYDMSYPCPSGCSRNAAGTSCAAN